MTSSMSDLYYDETDTVCPDLHRCRKGAVCLQYENHEGSYYCDCTSISAADGIVYAGLSCDHAATVYCTTDQSLSQTAFCANEGTCEGVIDKITTVEHFGCDCPPQYTGDHCEFVAAQGVPIEQERQPETSADAFPSQNSSPASGSSVGAVIGFSFAGIIICSLIAFSVIFMVRKRYNDMTAAVRGEEQGEDQRHQQTDSSGKEGDNSLADVAVDVVEIFDVEDNIGASSETATNENEDDAESTASSAAHKIV